MEEWREIEGHPGYEVSSEGRVRGPWGLRALTDNGFGYLKLNLQNKTLKVHQLVANAFLGPVPEELVVAHKNGIKTDNRAENLQVTTRHANALHMRAHGTAPCPVVTALRPRPPRAYVPVPPEVARANRLEGARRGGLKRRGRPRHDQVGSKNHQAKLCEFGVSLVFWYHSRGFTNKQVARCTGISDMQVGRILRGEKWKALHAEAKRLGYIA